MNELMFEARLEPGNSTKMSEVYEATRRARRSSSAA